MGNSFKTGFNTIYNVRIKCPSCKEEILAHAKKCPYCHADLTNADYVKANRWQSKASIILLIIVIIVILSLIFNSVNIFISIGIGLVLYGIGYFLILKIQSILNSIK